MIDDELSDPAVIGIGVRQGGLLSTILYNIYAEFMITEALDNNSDGIKIGGELVAAVRYADDQAMMSYTNAGLQRIMDALNDSGKDYGMNINIEKTKLMRISKQPGKVTTFCLLMAIKLNKYHHFVPNKYHHFVIWDQRLRKMED